MRRARPFRAMATLMLALSGVLSTGLPSHHHEDRASADRDVQMVSADHHSHGARLVEQDDRAPSGTPHVAAVSRAGIDLPPSPTDAVPPLAFRALRATERAPPPGAPRAPPLPG